MLTSDDKWKCKAKTGLVGVHQKCSASKIHSNMSFMHSVDFKCNGRSDDHTTNNADHNEHLKNCNKGRPRVLWYTHWLLPKPLLIAAQSQSHGPALAELIFQRAFAMETIQPPLPAAVSDAVNRGKLRIIWAIQRPHASLVAIADGEFLSWGDQKNLFPTGPAGGWVWVYSLRWWIRPLAKHNATTKELIETAILGIKYESGNPCITSGFGDIRLFMDALRSEAEIVSQGPHFVPYGSLLRIGNIVVRTLKKRAEEVRSKDVERGEHRKRKAEAQERQEEHVLEQAASVEAAMCRMDERLCCLQARNYTLSSRKESAHTAKLLKIAKVMEDKPLVFSEWTLSMLRECAQHGVELCTSGPECLVCPVFPEL